MELEHEIVGIRRRRSQLERAVLGIDDPAALALIRLVIEDMDARISALERTRQPETDRAVKPAQISN